MAASKPTIWERAIAALDEAAKEELKVIQGRIPTAAKPEAVAQGVVDAVETRKQALENRRWSFTFRGRARKVRDQLNVVLQAVKAVQEVGSALASLEPVYAGIPWACVNVIINLTVGNFEQHEAASEVLAAIAPILSRYTRIEAIYVGQRSISLKAEFEDCLVDLYGSILDLELRLARFYGRSSARRMVGSAINENDWAGMLTAIQGKDATCQSFTTIFDAEGANDRHLELQTLLKHQDEHMERILQVVERSYSLSKQRAQTDVLTWISVINPGNDHATVLEKTKTDTVFADACRWFFDHDKYKSWTTGGHDQASMLWIRGSIGTGKTTLISLVVEKALDQSATDSECRAAFFYCSKERGNPEGVRAKDVAAGLLRQLAFDADHCCISDAIQTAYDQGRVQGDYLADHTILELLQTAITASKQTIIIVDALDEMFGTESEILLNSLSDIEIKCRGKVKFCVSGRHEVDITPVFADHGRLDLKFADTSEDLNHYVEHRIRGGQPRLLQHGPKNLEDRLIKALVDEAQGLFKLADLRLASLFHARAARRSEASIEAYIRDMPAQGSPQELDRQYEKVYRLNTQAGSIDRTLAEKAYRLLLCSQRPLRIQEIVAAVGLERDREFDERVTSDYLCDITANFMLRTANGTVEFTHLSARNFLEQRRTSDFDAVRNHREAAKSCVAAFYGLPAELGPGQYVTNEDYLRSQKIPHYHFVRYALGAWPEHCLRGTDGSAEGEELQNLLNQFLEQGSPNGAFGQWRHYFGYSDAKTLWPTAKKRVVGQSNGLMIACAWGLTRSVKYLLQRYPDQAREANQLGMYAVHIAAQFEHEQSLAAVLEYAPDTVNNVQRHPEKNHAIHLAAENGNPDTVGRLILAGAKTDARRRYGSAPIHLAAGGGTDATFTVSQGSVDEAALKGKSPSYKMAMIRVEARIATLELLISTGADVNMKDDKGMTPLRYAAQAGIVDIGRFLLSEYAEIDAATGLQGTALHTAVIYGRLDFVQFLLDSGANRDSRLGDGGTALHTAVVAAQLEVAELLLRERFDIEARDQNGYTPLFLAAMNGYHAMAKQLLRRGADHRALDDTGRTPLAVVEHRFFEAQSPSGHRHFHPRALRLRNSADWVPPQKADWQGMLLLLRRYLMNDLLYPVYKAQSVSDSRWL